MPTYVVLINWTEQGLKAFKESPQRAKAADALAQRVGGRMKEVYWTLGSYDIVSIIEAPDDETVTSVLLALGTQGNIRTTTLRAFGADEFQKIAQKVP